MNDQIGDARQRMLNNRRKTESNCLYVLPEIFAQYHQLYPQVQISIYRNFSRKVLEKLEDSTIDVGIVTMPVKSQNLRVHSIFRDKLMLMSAQKMRWRKGSLSAGATWPNSR